MTSMGVEICEDMLSSLDKFGLTIHIPTYFLTNVLDDLGIEDTYSLEERRVFTTGERKYEKL